MKTEEYTSLDDAAREIASRWDRKGLEGRCYLGQTARPTSPFHDLSAPSPGTGNDDTENQVEARTNHGSGSSPGYGVHLGRTSARARSDWTCV